MVGFHGKGKTRSSTCSLVKAGRLTESWKWYFKMDISVSSESLTRGYISGFPSSIICWDSPFLSFHPSSSSPSQKSAGESDWEWPGESCNIVFHCSSFVCSLKCAQIEQGTNVIEWNAIIANKWKSANPLSTILNLASKEKQQNNFFRIKVCFHCVFFFIVFSFSLCFLFHCVFFFTVLSFSLLTNLTVLFSVSEVWCNVFVFFNACSDKIDITLIYLFFSLKKFTKPRQAAV